MFNSVETYSSYGNYLLERFEEIKSNQGFLGNFCDGVKKTFNLGASEKKCESILNDYNEGKISFEEAIDYIEKYDKEIDSAKNLVANIVTGIGAIAVATPFAPAGIGLRIALTFGAPAGALIKTAINTLDRATNDIKGDDIDLKEMAHDAIDGAVVGTTSAISSKMLSGVKDASLSKTILNSTKCAIPCGAIGSGVQYLNDCAFDENKNFNFGELTKVSASGALFSGGAGVLVGGGFYGVESVLKHTGKQVAHSLGEQIAMDSVTSSARKIISHTERNVIAA